nr:hypothetical protein CFP56_01393 [Quercus suber]
MASTYALPVDDAHNRAHSHSHSHLASSTIPQLSPHNSSDAANSAFSPTKSDSTLFTHQEVSRESSPNHQHHHYDHHRHQRPHSHDRSSQHKDVSHETRTFSTFPHEPQHNHTHSSSQSSTRSTFNMIKGRARGESDLGRPIASSGTPTARNGTATSDLPLSLSELLTALLIPLPYLLASAPLVSTHGHGPEAQLHSLSTHAFNQHEAGSHPSAILLQERGAHESLILQASALTSGTLLLVGVISKAVFATRTLDRRKSSSPFAQQINELMTVPSMHTMAVRVLSLGLPFYAAMQLGGLRVGLVMLMSIAANLTCADMPWTALWSSSMKELTSKRISVAVILISLLLDLCGWTFHASFSDIAMGYLALACSAVLLRGPLPTIAATMSTRKSPKPFSAVAITSPWNPSVASPMASSTIDRNATLLAGVVMSVITLGMYTLWSSIASVSGPAMLFKSLAVLAMSSAILFSDPASLRSRYKVGLGVACLVSASVAFLFSPELWPGTICNGGLSALSFIAVTYDTNGIEVQRLRAEHAHESTHDSHTHHHDHHKHEHSESHSTFTKFIIGFFRPGSLGYGILSEKDSRRIAYFTTYVAHTSPQTDGFIDKT